MSNVRLPLLIALLLAAPAIPAQTAPNPDARRPEARRRYERERERQPPVTPSAYNGHPRLAIILVLDDFRAGALDRWRADFDKDRGFSLFLDHGAYFPDCYFDYANTEAAPGDAAIATGAYTSGNGISANQWWNLARNQQRPVAATEDERYKLVGLPPSSIPGDQPGGSAATPKYVTGNSPQNLLASTLGDELRLATAGQSRVYDIALQASDAVLTAGAGANGVYWIDPASGYWISSSFYMPTLPDWVDGFNSGDDIALAEQAAGLTNVTNFREQVGATPAANNYELSFAEALIQNEQLGQQDVTDLLTISLSGDEGQTYAASSPEEEQAVDSLDTQLDGFLTWLDKNIPGGLGSVWIALTADRGVAPAAGTAAGYGLNAATLDLTKLVANLNLAMNMKFSPGEKIEYMMPHQSLPYISLNESEFMKDGIDEQGAEQAVQQALPAAINSLAPTLPEPLPSSSPIAGTQPASLQPSGKRLPPRPMLFRSYTRMQLANGALPPNAWGRLIANSYSPNGGWYVMVIPAAYQAATATAAFSPWAYSRHVPLAFWGAPFAPGEYLNQVQPVDLAPTFAALLEIHEPSASVGQVLTEALKPARDVVYPRIETPRTEPHPAPAQKPASPAMKPATKPPAPAATPTTKPSAPAAKPAVKPAKPAANKSASKPAPMSPTP
ncbi:MAG TPA: alkaline phosphatase family protein [Acidobacteriaceae bacterium]|nr:alkaline phosphatase family protein [Acidobacteriaceae bacterium]